VTIGKISKGTVTIDGVLYKAFENSFNRLWYVVRGTKSSDPTEAHSIRATSGKKALEQWIATLQKS
jgi:hypothetical protein